ncbi:hypothetical protein [Pseudomonas sp. CF161]|uniref:hypothetical protein n=1 Tax=Pseudomonas sp. CF161 TaxID=911241 RepID=UPI00035501E2|nr:hypothetical protein [Pseudomonas sp. CF161]EPL05310.1 hypothetical protein CF161_22446 [Pseudomonas sp. CF161]
MAVELIGLGSGIRCGANFGQGGLDESTRQRFAGAGVDAVQQHRAGGAAATSDKVVTGQLGHDSLLTRIEIWSVLYCPVAILSQWHFWINR